MSDDDSEYRSEDAQNSIRTQTAQALSEAGFGDVHVLSHDAADQALRPIYRELIITLDTEEIGGIRELARTVDRDEGNVKRNLDLLVEHDIVGFRKNGQRKQPYLKHDTILREPLVRPSLVD